MSREGRGSWSLGLTVRTVPWARDAHHAHLTKDHPEVRDFTLGRAAGGDSPVRGQGRGRGSRGQGFSCGLIVGGFGHLPCGERVSKA